MVGHLKFVKKGLAELPDHGHLEPGGRRHGVPKSAQAQALQTTQQLGVQALSIANQTTSHMLSLFR